MNKSTRERLQLFVIAGLMLYIFDGVVPEDELSPTIKLIRRTGDNTLLALFNNEMISRKKYGEVQAVTRMATRMRLAGEEGIIALTPDRRTYTF